jgi:AcrR family transcriptional regulator
MPRRKTAELTLEPGPERTRPTPRPLRPRDTADAIVTAAISCFEQWGIQRTRVEDIALEAGLARPNVYRHFASKEAIIHAVVLRAIQTHHRRLAEHFPLEGSAADLIVGTLISGIRDSGHEVAALTRSDSLHLTARSVASAPEIIAVLRDHWKPVLEYARQQGELRDHVDIDAATRWLVFVQLSHLAIPELDPPPDALEAELRAFVLAALLTNPGITPS